MKETPLKRSKTLPADGQTTKFLYTILKQLDLKTVDWNLVASQLEISNGHAARMRFSRFKQHMEGTTSTPRAARPKKPKAEKPKAKKATFDDLKKQPPPPPVQIKAEPIIKSEPSIFDHIDPSLLTMPYAPEPVPFNPFGTVCPADLTRPFYPTDVPVGYSQPPIGGIWPQVKLEPSDQDITMDDIFVKPEPEN